MYSTPRLESPGYVAMRRIRLAARPWHVMGPTQLQRHKRVKCRLHVLAPHLPEQPAQGCFVPRNDNVGCCRSVMASSPRLLDCSTARLLDCSTARLLYAGSSETGTPASMAS